MDSPPPAAKPWSDRQVETIRGQCHKFMLIPIIDHHSHVNHNILWGYDADANGPMIQWVIATLHDRLPTLLRRANATSLASKLEQQGWDTSVLPNVASAANVALAPREDDLVRAREGLEWMHRWKMVHPQFNTVEDGRY